VNEIITARDPEPAWRLIDALDSSGNEQAADEIIQIGFGVLLSWLTGARETLGEGVATSAVQWVADSLGPGAAEQALLVAGLLRHLATSPPPT
jgi:hypothetical protein